MNLGEFTFSLWAIQEHDACLFCFFLHIYRGNELVLWSRDKIPGSSLLVLFAQHSYDTFLTHVTQTKKTDTTFTVELKIKSIVPKMVTYASLKTPHPANTLLPILYENQAG